MTYTGNHTINMTLIVLLIMGNKNVVLGKNISADSNINQPDSHNIRSMTF